MKEHGLVRTLDPLNHSRIWSENWIVENSHARGEGLSVGTMWSGKFIARNVTFRNIDMVTNDKLQSQIIITIHKIEKQRTT